MDLTPAQWESGADVPGFHDLHEVEDYGAFCMARLEHSPADAEKWGYDADHPCLRQATVFYPSRQFCKWHDPNRP